MSNVYINEQQLNEVFLVPRDYKNPNIAFHLINSLFKLFLLFEGFLISNQPTVSIHHMVTYLSVQEILWLRH